MLKPIRIKICCIQSPSEARLALDAGAHALGLVSAMPSGPGVIDEEAIAAITAQLPPSVGSFLLTSLTGLEAIVEQQRRCRCNTIQLVDRVEPAVLDGLREKLPGISLVQVIHVTGAESLYEARRIAPLVNGLLLDSGSPEAPTPELGGTGRVHDWELSRQIIDSMELPVFLAGGLDADNVAEAIAVVRPFGVDVCSGLRVDGQLDTELLHRFVDTVRTSS